MSINAYITSISPPPDVELPDTYPELLALLRSHLGVGGLASILGVNVGPSEPPEADRDKPWMKLTSAGVILGWYGWTGSSWTKTPDVMARGGTADRPISPANGLLFFDTDISCLLIFDRGKWRTVAGSPGDVKFVATANLADALTLNPGWVQLSNASGRVLGAAGDGTALTSRAYGDSIGEEQHALTTDELPPHTHDYKLPQGSNADNGDPGNYIATASTEPNSSLDGVRTTDPKGTGAAVSLMQPTLFLWCLVKE